DVLAIAIHDLTEQRDFLHALPRQAAHLGHDFTHTAAALDTAPEGDDAERAGVRTAVHHRDVRRDQRAALVGRQHQDFLVLDGVAPGTFGVFDGLEVVLDAAILQKPDHRFRLRGGHE